MAEQPLRIGFIGAGNMGQMAHLRHYASLPDCRVTALFEPRSQLAQRVAARYDIERVYSSPDVMVESANLDGLVVPQPFNRHGQIVPPLYKYGIPLLTEKPLAASIEVGEQILLALERSTARHYIGYHKRSDLATQWVKNEIARLQSTQELGAMKYIRITMPPGDWISGGFDDLLMSDEVVATEFQVPADPSPRDMSTDEFKQYSGFVNYYIHQVNLLRHLLGEEYSVVFADKAGILLVAQSASGITGAIEMAPYQASLGWHETALIGFERGYLKLSLPAPLTSNRAGKVEAYYDGKDSSPRTVIPALPAEGAMRSQAKNFLRAIRGEATPLCTAQEALEDLRRAREYLYLWLQE